MEWFVAPVSALSVILFDGVMGGAETTTELQGLIEVYFMFANSSSWSAPSFSRGVVVACFASFIAAAHAIVEGGVLMAFFLAFAGFAVVAAIFGNSVRPTVSDIFSIDFTLIGW